LRTPEIVRRVLGVVAALFVLWWAVQGGEYGTTDLLRQRRAIAAERASIDSLERVVRGLQAAKRQVESDPVTQERIAREEFGMIRDGEILYRFVDTAAAGRGK
jgi:cell division protein FtsB